MDPFYEWYVRLMRASKWFSLHDGGLGVAGRREKGGGGGEKKREGEGHNPKKEPLYFPLV